MEIIEKIKFLTRIKSNYEKMILMLRMVKKKSRKAKEKAKFKEKYKYHQVKKEKKERKRKSSNRAARVYQRKRRVGDDPKKIFERIKYIFRRIFWHDIRRLVAKDIVEGDSLDTFVDGYRGTKPTNKTNQ